MNEQKSGIWKFAAFLLVAGVVAVGVMWLLKPVFMQHQRNKLSSSTSGAVQVPIVGDSYKGYWFFESPQMQVLGPANGVEITLEDDQGDVPGRVERFLNKEITFMVIPVAEYLRLAKDSNFPGLIVMPVARSRGADRILVLKDRVPNGAVDDLDNAGVTLTYAQGSASESLVEAFVDSFELPNLRAGSWRVPLTDYREVFNRAVASQGVAFVLWEPEASQALARNPNLRPIFDSGDLSTAIIDVLVVHADTLQREPALVEKVVRTYFQVLDSYAGNREQLIADFTRTTEFKTPAAAEDLFSKIEWYDLWDSCTQMMGIAPPGSQVTARPGLLECIIFWKNLYKRNGAFTSDPLPQPGFIIHKEILQRLLAEAPLVTGRDGSRTKDFRTLSEAEWARLTPIGRVRLEDIGFVSNSSELLGESLPQLDAIGQTLNTQFRDHRIVVSGHTRGADTPENRQLSLQRAQAVADYLVSKFGIDRDRIRAVGKGSSEPPPRRPDENQRAYLSRQARVQFNLYEDAGL